MKVKTYEQLMAKPDLEIYRRAIQYLSRGTVRFSCRAIRHAVLDMSPDNLGVMKHHNLLNRYTQQYRELCWRKGRPCWWNGTANQKNKAKRIKALEAMIAACERAGQEDAA